MHFSQETIIDRYRIERELGSGAMGAVYLARHVTLGTQHALKVVKNSFGDATDQKRLLREAQLQGRVRHPNVVSVTDCFEHEGHPVVVMEYVDGPSLAQFLTSGTIPYSLIERIADGLMRGVAAAHAQGLLHRDLKPGNILLGRSNVGITPKVADFGLARRHDPTKGEQLTAKGVLMGTPGYSPPEQLRDASSVDERADLFALGAILYELISGHKAFDGDSMVDIIAKTCAGEFAPLHQLREDIPPTWCRAITSALSMQPEQRPHSIAQFATLWGNVSASFPPTRLPEGMIPPWEDTDDLASTWHGGFDSVHPAPTVTSDRLVGREDELQALWSMIRGRTGLVSVVGMGGFGKTRLVKELMRRHRSDFIGGAYWCPLTEALTAEDVCHTVGTSLQLAVGQHDPVQQVARALRGRGRALLVLDRAEHLLHVFGPLLKVWLEQAPSLVILVSSREQLRLYGERHLTLEPLLLTSEEGSDEPSPAEALFLERSRVHRPEMVWDTRRMTTVRDIVQRLDGIPLAIELAAARLAVLSLDDLMKSLQGHPLNLSARGRDRDARHRTLHAAIDGSWDLLTPYEQGALVQSCVFRGGFTLAAAEAVLDLSMWSDAPSIMDLMDDLITKSFLTTRVPREAGGSLRFLMLKTLRAYATTRGLEDKPQLGELHAAAQRRHAKHYGNLGTEDALVALSGPDGPHQQAVFFHEVANLRAAVDYALENDQGDIAAHAAVAASQLYRYRGPAKHALPLLERILSSENVSPLSLIRVQRALALHYRLGGEPRSAMEHLQTALTLSREHGFIEEESWCLLHLSVAYNHARKADERDASIAALEQILKSHTGLHVEPSHLISAGNRALQGGDYSLAIKTYIEARGCAINLGLHRTLGSIEANLGAALDHVGRYNEALEHYQAGATLHERFGDQQSLARVQNNRGMCLLRLGRHEESRQQLEEAERIQRHLGNRRSETLVQGNLAELDYVEGHIDASRQRLKSVLQQISEMRLLFAEGTFLGLNAMLLVEDGREREARDTMTASIEILRRAGYPLLLARGLVRGATLALRIAEDDRAPAFLAEAKEIASTMNLSEESELLQNFADLDKRMTTI